MWPAPERLKLRQLQSLPHCLKTVLGGMLQHLFRYGCMDTATVSLKFENGPPVRPIDLRARLIGVRSG